MNQTGQFDSKTIGPRIRMMMPLLTLREASVVETVFSLRHFDDATPLKDVAQKADVSEAMVVKIAKKLGFSGYRDFRCAVAQYIRQPTSALQQELSVADSSRDIVNKVFRKSINALEETLASVDLAMFDRAADFIHISRQRDFYGIGGSAQIARDVAHKFLRVGIRSSVFDDMHMMLMSAALLTDQDVAIGISHSGTTAATLEALSLAKNNGARTIAVTNYATSPLANLADVILCSTSQDTPLMGENAAARIAQLTILDALFVAAAQRDYRVAEQNLEKTMSVVISKRKGTSL